MELKKTTLLSAMVCIAGVLAEIIFRDVLSKSVLGLVLSVLLAAVVLVLAYFTYDGLCSFWKAERELDREKQEQQEQKLYGIMNEQLRFERAIYQEVRTLKNMGEKLVRAQEEGKGESEESKEEAAKQQEQLTELLQKEFTDLLQGRLAELLQKEFTELLQGQATELLQKELTELLQEQVTEKQMADLLNETMAAQMAQITQLVSEQDTDTPQPDVEQVSAPVTISEAQMQQIDKLLKENTTTSAKVIARYISRSTQEIKELLEK